MTRLPIVSAETAQRVTRALQEARTTCRAPAVVLAQHDLLLTDHRLHQVRGDTIHDVAEHIRTVRFREILLPAALKRGATPSEVRRALLDRVLIIEDAARRGEF